MVASSEFKGSDQGEKSGKSSKSIMLSYRSDKSAEEKNAGNKIGEELKNSKGSVAMSASSSEKKSVRALNKSKEEGKAKYVRENCYDIGFRRKLQDCGKAVIWQEGKYVRDDCGSGIIPTRFDFQTNRQHWCRTPLSMYQATIGELGRQVLCREKTVPRDINIEPPCNMCVDVLPLCRGYYRKYECIKPCEEELARIKAGKREYRDPISRYWDPCLTPELQHMMDVNSYAHHNVALGLKIKRRYDGQPCW